MIQVRNLSKEYGNKKAIDSLSFDIDDGKIYGFLGPNGAGKSTTMNIITGYISATSGSVTIDGHDILSEPIAAKKCIGYLPELPPLYLDMTPREYLTFVAEAKGIGAEKTYFDVNSVMAQTGLDEVADRLMLHLSKGYCQRVGIAQALLGDPGIIILDEPTVGLDPKQIIEIRDLIRGLGKTRTVILSSHILAEISAVCDHIMILSEGRLVANDTPKALEASMNAVCLLSLTAKAEEQAVREVLAAIPGITAYTFESSGDAALTQFTLELEDGRDLRESIFLAFADARIPLLHMALRRMTLEDIFLKLTTKELPPPEETEPESDLPEDEYRPLFTTDANKEEQDA